MDTYEKKYKEALERAKDYYKANQKLGESDENEVLSDIFPELKDGEDERMMHQLHSWMKEFGGAEEYTEKVYTWLKSLLEKQGESYTKRDVDEAYLKGVCDAKQELEKQSEPIEINPTEFDTRLQALIGKFDSLPKEELIGSLSFWMNVVQNDGTYKADKKQSESELKDDEDERIRQELITFVKGSIQDEESEQRKAYLVWLEKQGEQKHIDNLTTQEAMDIAVAKCFEQGEQNPTDEEMKTILLTEYEKGRADAIAEIQKEWSEEDENILRTIISDGIRGAGFDMLQIDWLKSLKERYTWQPSDEQIKALHDLNLTGNISYAGQGQVLIGLYNDLKKLKGE